MASDVHQRHRKKVSVVIDRIDSSLFGIFFCSFSIYVAKVKLSGLWAN